MYFYNQGEVTPFAMSPKDLKLIESIPQMMDWCGLIKN